MFQTNSEITERFKHLDIESLGLKEQWMAKAVATMWEKYLTNSKTPDDEELLLDVVVDMFTEVWESILPNFETLLDTEGVIRAFRESPKKASKIVAKAFFNACPVPLEDSEQKKIKEKIKETLVYEWKHRNMYSPSYMKATIRGLRRVFITTLLKCYDEVTQLMGGCVDPDEYKITYYAAVSSVNPHITWTPSHRGEKRFVGSCIFVEHKMFF